MLSLKYSLQVFKSCPDRIWDSLLWVAMLEPGDMTGWPPKVLAFFDSVLHYNTPLIMVMFIIMAVIMIMKIKCLTALFIYEIFKQTQEEMNTLEPELRKITAKHSSKLFSVPFPCLTATAYVYVVMLKSTRLCLNSM